MLINWFESNSIRKATICLYIWV